MYVFLAGGMGITPFRSIIIDHVLRHKSLSAVLFHFAASEADLLFRKEFESAQHSIGLRYFPLLRTKDQLLSPAILTDTIVSLKTSHYYLSGSSTFVSSVQSLLQSLDVDPEQVKTDIFSGDVT